MKKVFAILLWATIVFALYAGEKIKIAPAPEIAAVRDDTASYSAGSVDYNNEKRANKLPKISRNTLLGNSPLFGVPKSITDYLGTVHEWEGIQQILGKGKVCLRYNYGEYYAVARMRQGGYFFVLFANHGSNALQRIDSCFVKKLVDVKKADKITIGDSLLTVKWKLSNGGYLVPEELTPSGQIYVCYFSDLTTRKFAFEDGRLINVSIAAPEDSVLTYILPQDLALIS